MDNADKAPVFPAHAGMNRFVTGALGTFGGVPRARGDEPYLSDAGPFMVQVFPAHAGMNRTRRPAAGLKHRVPRARGDEPLSSRA